MRKKETEERVRLLEYENSLLRHEITEIRTKLKILIAPMAPFSRIEISKLGCSWSLPTYEQLKLIISEFTGNARITIDICIKIGDNF